jgi:hypothetical protein
VRVRFQSADRLTSGDITRVAWDIYGAAAALLNALDEVPLMCLPTATAAITPYGQAGA